MVFFILGLFIYANLEIIVKDVVNPLHSSCSFPYFNLILSIALVFSLINYKNVHFTVGNNKKFKFFFIF